MKTLIASALLATVTLTGVASADVASAIAHFNKDADTQDQRISIKDSGFEGVVVSTRSGVRSNVFAHFNRDADTQDGINGLNGATVVSGKPTIAAEVFARLKAESLEDE